MGEESSETKVKRTIRKLIVKSERGGDAITHKNGIARVRQPQDVGVGVIRETIPRLQLENPVAPWKGIREMELMNKFEKQTIILGI